MRDVPPRRRPREAVVGFLPADPADVDDDRGWVAELLTAGSPGPRAALQVAELCVRRLDVSGAGVSIVTGSGVRESVCSTDAVAELLETLQFTLGAGPCVDAVQDRAPVLVSDLAHPGGVDVARWLSLLDGLLGAGARAVFAFPLGIGVVGIGALDLYRSSPGPLADEQVSWALAAAEVVTLGLLQAGADDGHLADAGSMRFGEVHQATGMAQVQLGVPTETAFLLLRARAFAEGRPVSDLAQDVVQRRIRFTQEDL